MGARPVQPIFVRVADAPAVLGLSRDTIERAHKRGELAIYKPVGVALVKYEAVITWRTIREARERLRSGILETPEGGPAPKSNPLSRTIRADLRAYVLKRDGEVCAYCKTTEGPFQIDHIVAFARGGPTAAFNLTPACKACNASKNATSLDEWEGRR
jgi:hypothetical protein